MPNENGLVPSNGNVAIDRPLIAFAFLAQTRRQDGDLLSGLAPIFKPIAKNRVGKRFEPKEFANDVRALYGIDIHPWAAEDLAPRLEKAGLLRKEAVSTTTYQYLYAPIEGEFNAVSEADIRLVVKRFIDFSTPILNAHKVPVDQKALEDGFFNQLIQMNFVAILRKPDRSRDDRKTLTTLTLKKSVEQTKWEEDVTNQAHIEVLCASFIMDAYRTDKDLYELMERIASGALVAEAVLNFQDPGGTVSLEKLTVILDAPFLMSMLNIASEEAYDYATALCKKLVDYRVHLAAFRHSAEEIRDNLEGVIAMSEKGEGFGPTARRLSSPTFHSYAHAVKTDPEAALKDHGIRLITPLSSQSAYQYFSDDDEDKFRIAIGDYRNPAAQRRDAASMAAVVRLRSGKRVRMTQFQNIDYIFITENLNVSQTAFRFLVRRNIIREDEVPAVLTDRYFAGLLLVLFGGKAEEVTRYRLLANCAAALEARNDVIRTMHRFLTEMDAHQANRFRALMTVERAGQHLMQLTLGDSLLVTNDNVPAILENVEKVLIEKERKIYEEQLECVQVEHAEELRRAASEHERQLGMAAATQETLRRSVLDANSDALEANSAVKSLQRTVERLEENLQHVNASGIELKRRQIEKALRWALRIEMWTHDAIAILLALIVAVLTYWGANTANADYALAIAIALGIVAGIAFWRAPDRIFGNLLRLTRDCAFRAQVSAYGLDVDAHEFLIDWNNQRVTKK